MSAAGDIANRASKGVSEGTPDLQGAVKTGSEIALRMEQAQQNRQKLEMQKQRAEQARWKQGSDAILQAGKITDPKQRGLYEKHVLPGRLRALGIEDQLGPEGTKYMMGEESRAKLAWFQSQFETGQRSVEEFKVFQKEPVQYMIDNNLPQDLQAAFAEAGAAGVSKLLGRQSQERSSGLARERLDFQKQQATEAGATALSKSLGKEGLPSIVNVLRRIDALVPDGLDGFKGRDIPGVGQTGKVPNILLSAKGSELRKSAQELVNIILKARSGGAINKEEAGRLLNEMGAEGGIFSAVRADKDFVTGMRNVRKRVFNILSNIESGTRPESLDLFRKRQQSTGADILSSDDAFFQSSKAKKAKPKSSAQLAAFDEKKPSVQAIIARDAGFKTIKEYRTSLGAK